jgi:hypothetical protein
MAKSNAKGNATKGNGKNNAATGTALAKRGANAVATAAPSLRAFSGRGKEKIEQRHLAVPFLSLLQEGSPQAKKRSAAYVDGAEAGMFFYSLDQSLFGVMEVVPCYFHSNVVEWFRRDEGGGGNKGMLGQYPDMETARANRKRNDNESQLVETYNFILLIVDRETGETYPAIFPCTSTKLGPAKQWIAQLLTYKQSDEQGEFDAALFARYWTLESVFQTRNNYEYFNIAVTAGDDLDPNDEFDATVLERANALYESFDRGEARPNYENTGVREVSDEDEGDDDSASARRRI